jgi:hypothetical protein
MKSKTRFNLLFLLLPVLVLGLVRGMALGETQTFTGKAFDVRGALEYIEQHHITYEGKDVIKSRTTYLDEDERVIGYLHSEYTPLPQFSNYTFQDLRNQYEDGVRLETDRICLFRKEDPNAEEETVCLAKGEQQIIGQGFHHFIVTHLEAIAEGNIFHVKLALPSRLDQFSFRIRKVTKVGDNLLIRLEVDNWFLRIFVPHVDVNYERESGRLMRYEGISNVADASGRFKKVKINYFY